MIVERGLKMLMISIEIYDGKMNISLADGKQKKRKFVVKSC